MYLRRDETFQITDNDNHLSLNVKVSSLLKYMKLLSELRSFNLRRGNLEILFLPKFQKKHFLQKSDDHCIIPVT